MLFLPVGTQVFVANTEEECNALVEKYFSHEKVNNEPPSENQLIGYFTSFAGFRI